MARRRGIMRDAEKRAASQFDRRPKAPVVARPFQRFREANAAANYNAPARDGSRPGIFQIPLRPERMTKFGLRIARVPRDGAGPSLPDRAGAREHRPAAVPSDSRVRPHLGVQRRLGPLRRAAGGGDRVGTTAIRKGCSASSMPRSSARAGWSSIPASTRSAGRASRRSTTASRRARSNATSSTRDRPART